MITILKYLVYFFLLTPFLFSKDYSYYIVTEKISSYNNTPMVYQYSQTDEEKAMVTTVENFTLFLTLQECPYVNCLPYYVSLLFLNTTNKKQAKKSTSYAFWSNNQVISSKITLNLIPLTKKHYKNFGIYMPNSNTDLLGAILSALGGKREAFIKEKYDFSQSNFKQIKKIKNQKLWQIYKQPNITSEFIQKLNHQDLVYIKKRTNQKKILFREKGEWVEVICLTSEDTAITGYIFDSIVTDL